MQPNRDKLIERLKAEEGYSEHAFWDNKQWSWGYGTATDGPGNTTRDNAERELGESLDEAIAFVNRYFADHDLTETRADALTDMVYNMGAPTFLKFKRMNAAIDRGDWIAAAEEARQSQWYRQVGARAKRIVDELRNG
jgi:lysozyme